MHSLADFTLSPMGVGTSVSPYIAIVKNVLDIQCPLHGIKYEMHSNGTNLEGDWNAILLIVKQCRDAVHAGGVIKVGCSVKHQCDKQQAIKKNYQTKHTTWNEHNFWKPSS
ncbi:hypothetical protein BDR26DRAFT_124246 [Obelidium mucronatum]|nr:hypothetical protein BDR26DRAFT_124246 [Obelidium mucronatum]